MWTQVGIEADLEERGVWAGDTVVHDERPARERRCGGSERTASIHLMPTAVGAHRWAPLNQS